MHEVAIPAIFDMQIVARSQHEFYSLVLRVISPVAPNLQRLPLLVPIEAEQVAIRVVLVLVERVESAV